MHIHVGSVDTPRGIQDFCSLLYALTLKCGGIEEGNFSLDGRAGIQWVLSALSDQLTEGNDLNENDLPACLTPAPRFPLSLSVRLWLDEESLFCRRGIGMKGHMGQTEAGGKCISFVAEVQKPRGFEKHFSID